MTLPPPTTDTPDVDPVQNGADLQLLFTAMPAGSELSDKKAKSGDEISPYGCFLNAYHPGESEPYRYWSVYLHYPEPIAEEAGDRKASYKYRLKDASDKVYLLANCVIPATQNAANLVDRLLRESLSEYESTSTVAKSNLAPQPVNTGDDWCGQPNDEGFSCREGSCWLNDDMNSCCGFNPLGEYECGLPELEEVAEIEDCLGDDCGGGGSGLPWPIPPAPPEDPSDPNPWEPIIPGGSSDPCETCDPGENPDDDEQTCPLGQIDDGFGNCIDEEGDPEPCVGDPLLDLEITPTPLAGKDGGRFRIGNDAVRQDRFGNKINHKGFDLSTPLNPPTSIYAMFTGTVSAIRDSFTPGEYKEDSLGNFVQITSTVNGQTLVIKFNHLNSVNVEKGQLVTAGDIIGIGGNTGNAASEGVIPHTHIQAWVVSSSGWQLTDPENFLTTQFDQEGNISNNCN